MNKKKHGISRKPKSSLSNRKPSSFMSHRKHKSSLFNRDRKPLPRCDRPCTRNIYENNPNVVSLIWKRGLNGFDENDPDFDKMAAEGYDTGHAKRIVAELNALGRSMNYGVQNEPNYLLMIFLCFLCIFPACCYFIWWMSENEKDALVENKFRMASQVIVKRHN